MNSIVVIVSAKDRVEDLQKTLTSLASQSPNAPKIAVVSDSREENFAREKRLCADVGATLLRGAGAHNRASRFNVGIRHLVSERMIKTDEWVATLFVGFLAAGETWPDGHAAQSWADDDKHDVLYAETGENGEKVPDDWAALEPRLFVCFPKGPTCAGSLIRFTLMLELGLFDETLPGMAWRDMLVRIAMARPPVARVLRPLPAPKAPEFADAELTQEERGASIVKFYAKHRGLIDRAARKRFFAEAEAAGFAAADFNAAAAALAKERAKLAERRQKGIWPPSGKGKAAFDGTLRFGVVTSDPNAVQPLFREINEIDYPKKEIIVFANFPEAQEWEKRLNAQFGPRFSVPVGVVYAVGADAPDGKAKKCLPSLARDLLCHRLWGIAAKNDATVLVNHDVVFAKRAAREGKRPADALLALVNRYLADPERPDAVLLPQANVPPEPFVAIPRVRLLDALYAGAYGQSASDGTHRGLEFPDPEAFDASLTNDAWREQPVFAPPGKNAVNDAFERPDQGERPLDGLDSRYAESLAGCGALVLNREVLRVPHALGPFNGRFGGKIVNLGYPSWLTEVARRGFVVKRFGAAAFVAGGKRPKPYDYREGARLRLKRMVCAAYAYATQPQPDAPAGALAERFVAAFHADLVNVVLDYARTFGLLNQLVLSGANAAKKWRKSINPESLSLFVNKAADYVDYRHVAYLFRKQRDRAPTLYGWQPDETRKEIARRFGDAKLRELRFDHAAMAFTDGSLVYRVLHGPYGAKAKTVLKAVAGLPEHAAFARPELQMLGESPMFIYPYDAKAAPYRGGRAREMAEFLYFLKRNGWTLANVEREDFCVAERGLAFIGYGCNLIPYTPEAGLRAQNAAYAALGEDRPPREEFGQVTLKS